MTKCSQKYAQYAFRSILKQKIAIKLKKHQSEKQKSAKKKHKKSTFQLNQAQKQATRKSSKNPKLHKKNKPKLAGKPQGWQHWPVSQTIFSVAPFLKTDNALCCITKHIMPKCQPQFEGMRDFWTSTRRKVFRFNQKFRKF